MNEDVTNTTFASTQKINDIIKKAYNKTSYSIEDKSHSNEKYNYDNEEMTQDLRKLAKEVEKATINIKDNTIEIVNILEKVISNDATKEEEIPLPLQVKLRRRDVTINEEEIPSMCDNY